jgi:hypothetical protein
MIRRGGVFLGKATQLKLVDWCCQVRRSFLEAKSGHVRDQFCDGDVFMAINELAESWRVEGLAVRARVSNSSLPPGL